jgi:hypothetical protein
MDTPHNFLQKLTPVYIDPGANGIEEIIKRSDRVIIEKLYATFFPSPLKHTCRSDYLLLCKRQVAKTMFHYLKNSIVLSIILHTKGIQINGPLNRKRHHIPDELNDPSKKQNHVLIFLCHELECACLVSVKEIIALKFRS